MDLLTVTMTTVECLHRFCNECIVTALRSGREQICTDVNVINLAWLAISYYNLKIPGNKECPTCRKKLVSKRSLRPDPNFDQLVSKLCPDKEEVDEQQEKARFVHAKRLCRKRHLAEDVNEASSEKEEEPSGSVRVRLAVHSDMEESLQTRISPRERTIETVSSANIGHLVEYVRVRLGLELGLPRKAGKENADKNIEVGELNNINIYRVDQKGTFAKLDETQTLSSLSDEKGEEKELLELYFNCDLEMMKPC